MSKLYIRICTVGSLVILLLSIAALAVAQDDPLPTKTPSPTPEPPTTASSSQPSSDPITLAEPFIQSDLEILSGNVQRPNGLFWHNGKVYASCNGDWTLYEIDAETGATITYLWGIRNAHTLYVEDDERGGVNLWVPDFQTNSLIRVVQRTTQTVASGLNGPWGIAPLDDRFLVTNLLANNIVAITREGAVEEIAADFRSPAGIAVDESAIYVANNGSARRAIEWIDRASIDSSNTINSSPVAPQPLVTGLQNPTGLTLGPDGYLYVSYALGTRGVIGRIQPEMCRENGGCTNNEVEIVVYTDLAAPLAGLAISPDMKLYTHTIFSPDIYFADLSDGNRVAMR